MPTDSILPRATGQWMDAEGGPRWWFDSGSLALDFASIGGQHMTDSPPELMAAWLVDRFPEIASAPGAHELRDGDILRAAIARLAAHASRGEPLAPEDVDVVNLFAAMPDIPPVLAGGSRQAGRSAARPQQALGSIARDAVRVFGPDIEGRIRECDADDCELVYLDTSRSGTRRWCSMQRCGNRAKVRAHRARAARSARPLAGASAPQ
ncbi:CGNR zinc finger domain-containing protein [Leifsonia sp. AG29]|uniref:CGNR zinc finger domain-containing protein n=1 Tax=Leifsonia sp. AG29 TaxID=2598860 RepID=UPI001E4C1CE7|nr:CGNR zinc finger domain-containing protein [Leifsonia sp. AG29]